MPMSVPHSKETRRDIIVYNASHPSVIFRKLRTGALRHWNQNRLVQSVHRWLKPLPKERQRTPDRNRPKTPDTRNLSGLILPQRGESFMFIQNGDVMCDLLAENQRLRSIVDELIRQENRERIISPPG